MTQEQILNLFIPDDFGGHNDGEDTGVIEAIYEQLDRTSNTAYGATKFVIIEDKVVYKIPFEGMYYCDTDEDSETYDESVFTPFHTPNYCAVEADLYKKAKDAGVAEFFASTEFLGCCASGNPIYVSEKVNMFDEERELAPAPSEGSRTKARTLKKEYKIGLPVDWLAAAIEFYGADKVNLLVSFVSEHDIWDLHTDNLGIRDDGGVVILDYSGYDE